MTNHESEEDRRRREARDREIDRLIEQDRRSGEDRRQADPDGSGTHALAGASQMPGGVWLYQELTALRTLITDQHSRVRSDVAAGFAKVAEQLRDHEAEDREVAIRVALLEDREARAKAEASRRGALIGGAVAAVVGPTAAAIWRKLTGG